MILERKIVEGEALFMTPDGQNYLRTHELNDNCIKDGCLVHAPTVGPLSDAPYNWRGDRGIMERICTHGVGHPDHDGAAYQRRIGREFENVHGCDGCCA